MHLSRFSRTALIIIAIVWFAHRTVTEVIVDWLWFDAAGYLQVFETSLIARVGLGVAGFVLTALFLWANVRYAQRVAPIDPGALHIVGGEVLIDPKRAAGLLTIVLGAVVILPAIMFGVVSSSLWLDVLSFVHRVPFGVTEEVFGRDVSFFVFELPMIGYARGLSVGVLVLTALITGVYYVFHNTLIGRSAQPVSDAGRKHLLVLTSMLFLLAALGWWLDRFDLLYQRDGAVWGIGYTDEHARIPAFWAMTVVSLLASVALLVSVRQKTIRSAVTAIGGYLIARMLLTGAWPGVVQQYSVEPNELGMETPYLKRNIEATRNAFALDRIEVKPFDAAKDLTMADLDANSQTVDNIRVWDDRPLLTTYRQIQEIRLYYDFADVDVDRYIIDGESRQVMLAGRELNYANVPANAQSWFNEHLQYTHGYGLTMSPVNVVTEEGMPELFIKDIPPVSSVDIPIDRPEIYYGELTDRWVLVGTKAEEFDYPTGDKNAYTRYSGAGGVPIGTTLRKALFSVYYQSLDILMSDYVQPGSKIMFRRQIRERLDILAPFLRFDRDPYMVVHDGRLLWMVDAYTVTDKYPYAEHFRLPGQDINYIRNSVKAVIDAYNGTVDLFVSDPDDPMIQVYDKVFPGTFKSMDLMDEGLRSHVRYPADFFDVQAAMYRAYHMVDTTVFYNREDMWEAPRELFGSKEQIMQSYYLIMKLPGEETDEFILLVPFVPTNKDNMISWLAARCDPENYGRLVLYQFPKQKLIYGPRQIEARIDQTPEISEQMTLWSQAGSRVVRGNLLVIPIEDSLMYVEAVYLQAESSQLPELKRVIVSYESRIAMEPTLDAALRKVFGGSRAERFVKSTDEEGSPVVVSRSWQSQVDLANILYQEAIEAQKEGEWAAYGEALESLEQTLVGLNRTADASAK